MDIEKKLSTLVFLINELYLLLILNFSAHQHHYQDLCTYIFSFDFAEVQNKYVFKNKKIFLKILLAPVRLCLRILPPCEKATKKEYHTCFDIYTKTSGRFFQTFVALTENLNFIRTTGRPVSLFGRPEQLFCTNTATKSSICYPREANQERV